MLAKIPSRWFLFCFLEYSCFTMLCSTLYSKVNQPYTYVDPLFFGFPSHLGHQRALSRVTCAIQWVLTVCVCVCVCVTRSAVSDSLDSIDCSSPGSSVHGILQARILQWVAISSSRGSSQPRDQTQVSCTANRLFTV